MPATLGRRWYGDVVARIGDPGREPKVTIQADNCSLVLRIVT
jgi:hypothetical protein